MTDERLNCIKEQLSEGIALFFRDDVQWLVEQYEEARRMWTEFEAYSIECEDQRDDARWWARHMYTRTTILKLHNDMLKIDNRHLLARDAARSRTPSDFWACEAPDTCDCPQCNDT